jgi:AcrR family transcriptional regulator
MPRVADPRTRIVLLRAAEAVFSDRGLSAAKVEEITTRAGVSKGAFYLHFKSKEDCFRQIVEGVLARLALSAKSPAIETVTGPNDIPALLKNRLRESYELFEFCWQNRGIMKMILEGGGGSPYAYLIDEFAAGIVQQSEKWIAHATTMGLYRSDIDPAIVARLISGTYERLVRELIKQPRRPDIEGWARQAQDLLTRGLFAPNVSAIIDQNVNLHSAAEASRAPQAEAKTK